MMKKVLTTVLALGMILAVYAENDKSTKAKAINYKDVLEEISYPQSSREQGIEGVVLVDLRINKNGKITNYRFVEYPCSDMKAAVEQALSKLTFEPARNKREKATAGMVTLPVKFQLKI